MILFDAHVGPRKRGGGEADQGGQRDQEHVERIDEELLARQQQRSVADNPHHQRTGGDQCGQADGDVEFGRALPGSGQGQRERAEQRDSQYQRKLHLNPP